MRLATAELLQEPITTATRAVRVCFMIDELSTAGTETQLLALIRHLDRTRIEPYLCLLRGVDSRSQALEPEDCPVLRLGITSFRQPSTIPAAWRLIRFLRRERIDVFQVYFPDSTYLGVPAAWLAGVPHILRTRNNLGYWLTPWHRRLGRWYSALCDGLIANCDACRDAIVADEGLSPERIVVLENGVDLARFPEPAIPERTGRVGVVANLRPVKGLDVFVHAAAAVSAAHPQATFHIAGDGPLREALGRMADELRIVDRLTLHGSLTEIPAFLAGLEVAVLPSLSEGMSNALLEYMAAGRPIVASAVGAGTRLIEDGVSGLLVPPGDANCLAAAIGRLLAEPALAARLGAAARRVAEERYGRAAMVQRFETYYRRLVAA